MNLIRNNVHWDDEGHWRFHGIQRHIQLVYSEVSRQQYYLFFALMRHNQDLYEYVEGIEKDINDYLICIAYDLVSKEDRCLAEENMAKVCLARRELSKFKVDFLKEVESS